MSYGIFKNKSASASLILILLSENPKVILQSLPVSVIEYTAMLYPSIVHRYIPVLKPQTLMVSSPDTETAMETTFFFYFFNFFLFEIGKHL